MMVIMLAGLKTVTGFGDDGKLRPGPWKATRSYLLIREKEN